MDYLHCYRVLGLEADSDWNTARQRYRALAARLHPDRPGHDSDGPDLVDINLAYRALKTYHLQHRRLPLQQQTATTTPFMRKEHLSQRADRRRRMPAIAMTLALALITGYLLRPQDSNEAAEPAPPPAGTSAPQPADRGDDDQLPSRIMHGDRLGHVAEVLGPPDDTIGDRWYYGNSWIEFREGRVANWYSSVDSPLPTEFLQNSSAPSTP